MNVKTTVTYDSNYEILNWESYPDIDIKRYSNNGRIVDADDEYLQMEKHKPVISNRSKSLIDFFE